MSTLSKKLSLMALCTVFASMQIAMADGLSNATMNNATGGFAGMTNGANSATLNFTGDSHVTWDKLNVGAGETLNFNAINGASGLTVVNTVTHGMSDFAGTVTSNEGIAKLIISNPNGMILNGSKFITAGDLMITTQGLNTTLNDGKINYINNGVAAVKGIEIKNKAAFNVGGTFNLYAPDIKVVESAIRAKDGVKLVTRDGYEYLVSDVKASMKNPVGVELKSVFVDGNVMIVSGEDFTRIVNGAKIDGNLVIDSQGAIDLNSSNKGETLSVARDVTVKSTGNLNFTEDGKNIDNFMYLRNADIKGNVSLANTNGFVDVKNVHVAGDATINSGNVNSPNPTTMGDKSRHYVHIAGDTSVDGNLTVNSAHNVHIGGYNYNAGEYENGSLKVGKDLNVTAEHGTIAVSVDTSAKNVNMESKKLNIISGNNAKISADAYTFKANEYVGGIAKKGDFINIMEKYELVNSEGHKLPITDCTYLNIAGGDVVARTDNDGLIEIKSEGNMNVNGLNAKTAFITSNQNDIKIGTDVHAKEIKVGGETKNLTVDLPNRDYELKYTDIKDTEVITIAPDTTITYEMANGNNGWNQGTQTEKNTYLVVPGPGPGPGPEPGPTPTPTPTPNPQDNDNVKVLNNLVPTNVDTAAQAYTPIAFAADLDEDEEKDIRKNVDGSVTVVRPFTPND